MHYTGFLEQALKCACDRVLLYILENLANSGSVGTVAFCPSYGGARVIQVDIDYHPRFLFPNFEKDTSLPSNDDPYI